MQTGRETGLPTTTLILPQSRKKHLKKPRAFTPGLEHKLLNRLRESQQSSHPCCPGYKHRILCKCKIARFLLSQHWTVDREAKSKTMRYQSPWSQHCTLARLRAMSNTARAMKDDGVQPNSKKTACAHSQAGTPSRTFAHRAYVSSKVRCASGAMVANNQRPGLRLASTLPSNNFNAKAGEGSWKYTALPKKQEHQIQPEIWFAKFWQLLQFLSTTSLTISVSLNKRKAAKREKTGKGERTWAETRQTHLSQTQQTCSVAYMKERSVGWSSPFNHERDTAELTPGGSEE